MSQNQKVKLSDYRALAEFRYQIRRFVALAKKPPAKPLSSRNIIS